MLNPTQLRDFLNGLAKTQEMVQSFLHPTVKHLEKLVSFQHIDLTEIHASIYSHLNSLPEFYQKLNSSFSEVNNTMMLVQENQTSILARVETVENWLRNDLNNAIIETINSCSISKE